MIIDFKNKKVGFSTNKNPSFRKEIVCDGADKWIRTTNPSLTKRLL